MVNLLVELSPDCPYCLGDRKQRWQCGFGGGGRYPRFGKRFMKTCILPSLGYRGSQDRAPHRHGSWGNRSPKTLDTVCTAAKENHAESGLFLSTCDTRRPERTVVNRNRGTTTQVTQDKAQGTAHVSVIRLGRPLGGGGGGGRVTTSTPVLQVSTPRHRETKGRARPHMRPERGSPPEQGLRSSPETHPDTRSILRLSRRTEVKPKSSRSCKGPGCLTTKPG